MKSSTYFIRVLMDDQKRFSDYLSRNKLKNTMTGVDLGPERPSATYTIRLTLREVMSMKLSFNLCGILRIDLYDEGLDPQC